MVTLERVLKRLNPKAIAAENYYVTLDPSGRQVINGWDPALGPRPTESEIAAETEKLAQEDGKTKTDRNADLAALKMSKNPEVLALVRVLGL